MATVSTVMSDGLLHDVEPARHDEIEAALFGVALTNEGGPASRRTQRAPPGQQALAAADVEAEEGRDVAHSRRQDGRVVDLNVV